MALPGQVDVDALAVPTTVPLSGEGARIVDEKLGGRLARLVESGELRGERGETHVLYTSGELESPRVVAVGLGTSPDRDAFRTAGAVVAQALARVGGTVGFLLDESLALPLADQAGALVEGAVIGGGTPGGGGTRGARQQ